MLTALTLKNLVLIDHLSLCFGAGFTAFTGETGAGKSIILDALGLVLGARGDRDLIRAGAAETVVSAAFTPDARIRQFLEDRGLPVEDELIVRRVLRVSGSAQFVNDAPVSVSLLKTLGELLVEIHGQRDSHALLSLQAQKHLLDGYAGTGEALTIVQAAWTALKSAEGALAEAKTRSRTADSRRDEVQEALAALDRLAPKAGEEAELADEKSFLALSESLTSELSGVVSALSQDLTHRLSQGLRGLMRAAARAEKTGAALPERLNHAIAACERAMSEAEEAVSTVDEIAAALEFDPRKLQAVDDRLHALRSAGRRYGVAPDDLETYRQTLVQELNALEDCAAGMNAAEATVKAAQAAYHQAAAVLTQQRQSGARRLQAAMQAELPSLKLDKVAFAVVLTLCAPGPDGVEQVAFHARTNPDLSMGPIAEIASGGEFARFVLALKATLAGQGGTETLVFDEVDQGVGGAVAEAIGRRFEALGVMAQVLAVTHSPQVAARAAQNIKVEKTVTNGVTHAHARLLTETERREEIARMLAGEVITDAARAAADALMERA